MLLIAGVTDGVDDLVEAALPKQPLQLLTPPLLAMRTPPAARTLERLQLQEAVHLVQVVEDARVALAGDFLGATASVENAMLSGFAAADAILETVNKADL